MAENLVLEAESRLPDAITETDMRRLVAAMVPVSVHVAGVGAVQYQQTASTIDENARADLPTDGPAAGGTLDGRSSATLTAAKADMPADV